MLKQYMTYKSRISLIFILISIATGCKSKENKEERNEIISITEESNKDWDQIVSDTTLTFGQRVGVAAQSIIDPTIYYDPAYRQIPYPNGDVPASTGVCTDVVIRTYRVLGIDLQQFVHEDMKAHFSLYPSQKMWGLKSTDKNIDHRRVPNLQCFFERNGEEKIKSTKASDYSAGDIVAWKLPNGLLHIGVVIDQKSRNGVPLVVHNIGGGQVAENVLFAWDIIGHYSYSN